MKALKINDEYYGSYIIAEYNCEIYEFRDEDQAMRILGVLPNGRTMSRSLKLYDSLWLQSLGYANIYQLLHEYEIAYEDYINDKLEYKSLNRLMRERRPEVLKKRIHKFNIHGNLLTISEICKKYKFNKRILINKIFNGYCIEALIIEGINLPIVSANIEDPSKSTYRVSWAKIPVTCDMISNHRFRDDWKLTPEYYKIKTQEASNESIKLYKNAFGQDFKTFGSLCENFRISSTKGIVLEIFESELDLELKIIIACEKLYKLEINLEFIGINGVAYYSIIDYRTNKNGKKVKDGNEVKLFRTIDIIKEYADNKWSQLYLKHNPNCVYHSC